MASAPSRTRAIVAQKAEWEVALGDNPRLVASYVQPELRAGRRTGARRAGSTASASCCRASSVVPTGGHSTGHQAIVVRGTGAGARTLAFFGDLFMRPWGANPRWVTAFDDFPLDSVVRKAELFAPGRRRGLADRALARGHAPRRPPGPRPRPLPLRAGLARKRRLEAAPCRVAIVRSGWRHGQDRDGVSVDGGTPQSERAMTSPVVAVCVR